MTSAAEQVIRLAIERRLIRLEFRSSVWVCLPGTRGNKSYLFNIKEDLKAARFRYSKELGWHRRTYSASRASRYYNGEHKNYV